MSEAHTKMKKATGMIDLVHKAKGQFIAPRETINKIQMLAPEAVNILEELMKGSKADSVRLKAALEVLALSGITKETTIRVKTDIAELDTHSIDERLQELLGTAAHTVVDSQAKDITPVEEVH
jgi:hypothetical protein